MLIPELSLIIPAFNESSIIIPNLDELSLWVSKNIPESTYEIVVVDDGSTDGMGKLLNEAVEARSWLSVVHHDRNFGRGRGIRSGFEASQGKYIICLDADLSYAPNIVSKLLAPLKQGEADVTLASAHHPKGRLVNVPLQRKMLSKLGNLILSMGFEDDFHTLTCIVRGFTRKVVDSLELVSDGKELHLEIIQKTQLMGYRILELPATLEWRNKKRRDSKINDLFPEIAIFKLRKTVLSHLIFNYITNPGVLLLVPLLILLGIISTTAGMLLISFIPRFSEVELSAFQALRQTFIDGQLTLLVCLFSTITFMVFLVFYFLSYQNKRYFEETYTLMMRMNSRLKKVERKCS